MTKLFKRVTIAAMAAGLAISAACITANASTRSAFYQTIEHNASFEWNMSNAIMTNLDQKVRHASAAVEVRNNTTGRVVDSDNDVGDIGYYESVSASVSGYSTSDYNFTLKGTISTAGTHYAPIEWDPERKFPAN